MTAPLPGSLLAEIIGISSDAIICVGSDQRVTFFNEGAVRIFGYAADEVLGQPLEMLLPVGAKSMHRHHIERFVNSPVNARRMGERQEIAGRRKNGEEFPAEAAIAKLKAGNEVFASVVLRDVTDRKRAEQRQKFLVETSERLASSLELDETLELLARLWIPMFGDFTVVEMPAEGALYHVRALAGPDGSVEQTRMTADPGQTLLPMPGDDESGRSGVSFVPVDAALEAVPACYVDQARAHGARMALTVPLSHRGEALGRVTIFTKRKTSLGAADLALVEDLARRASIALENARLHDQVQRALRARDDTEGVVSHDLRNPVNAVKMLAGALLQPDRSANIPADVTEQVRVIQSAAEQMDALIQDLLDMSRVEAGRFDVDVQGVPASSLLHDALRTLAPLAEDKQVAVVTDWIEPLPDVQVDPERIAQVVSNVVGNAIKFTPKNGRIRIAAAEREDSVIVSVTDNGPGITAQHLPHVFDRYWQSSRRNRGAGLGLPIAKAIIEAHGGRIWAESEEGSGATFHFTLPR
jgi:PAS domain S-box-containing protein